MSPAQTIPEVLLAAAEREADKTWLRTDDTALTFGEAANLAFGMRQRLAAEGIGRADVVMVTAKNTGAYLIGWLALTSLGAIALTVDPRGTANELSGFLNQVRPRAVLSDGELLSLFDQINAQTLVGRGVFDISELLADIPADSSPAVSASIDVGPDDIAVLIPTSGTTGRSKLVMQTHRAYTWAGEGFPFWMGLTTDDRLMTSLPLFHINAPAYSMMGSLSVGAEFILLPRFSASGFLDSARRFGATEFNAIGAMLEILVRQPPRDDDAQTELRLCYTGPSPAKEWQEAFEERFGLRVVCGYALSESPYGLIWPHGSRPFGTLGTVRQHPRLGLVNHARVVDDLGADVPTGSEGELWLQNPVVTPGYWDMPDETAATVVDGWLRTGDLVTASADGTYTFISRQKEVLRRRGENMSPLEIEEAIGGHPDVKEVAVIGVASELSEQEVKAFVVPEEGRSLDFATLREWSMERLSAFKVPRFWQAVDELPRTPTERVAKHRLPQGHTADEFDAESASPAIPAPPDKTKET